MLTKKLKKNIRPQSLVVLLLCCMVFSTSGFAQTKVSFDPSKLNIPGDEVRYGSYLIRQISDGAYQINDPGDKKTKSGGWGVDMYLVCGSDKALMIDLGNNYIKGRESNLIVPRKNAAEELREVVYGLAGDLPLEIAITHNHPDHNGMAGAFADQDVKIWIGKGEDLDRLKNDHNIDPSILTVFNQGEKTFDLGDGQIVETYLIRGHSDGGTAYLVKPDMLLFTGDCIGSGFGQSLRSVEKIKVAAVDSKKMVEIIMANYSPYERYSMKVFTGHWWQNVYGGFITPNKKLDDLGYMDWRFVQNFATLTNGILEGKWLEDGSGLIHVADMKYTDAWPNAVGQAIMIYGTATVITPIEVANEAAGL